MSKRFFEVFPTLKVNDNIGMLFQDVEVTKVATNKERDFIRVHILSRHLLDKKTVCASEESLKDQLFARSGVRVSIVERYELSGQYTPENLMNEYLESFLMELGQKSVIEKNMLSSAKCTFEEGNILCIRLVDSIVARGREEALSSYLRTVYRERFGMDVDVRVIYEKAKESKLKYNELRLEQAVKEILKKGYRTVDIMSEGCTQVSCGEMGDLLADEIR